MRHPSTVLLVVLINLVCRLSPGESLRTNLNSPTLAATAVIDPARDLGIWEGWGSSLSWWARAIGGTRNADYYADLIYTTRSIDGYPGLGLNIVRYNVGGGGVNQPEENKGRKLQWQMDIHGFWVNRNDAIPASVSWDWSLDSNQRTILAMAHERGANVFELFSNSPVWWMNANHSTAGSNTGRNCLLPENYSRFANYLATVARFSADHWGIKFSSVEPFNEPSADWWKYPNRQEGCHFDANTQPRTIQLLRAALDHMDLANIAVSAADENDVDVALSTWNSYDENTRAAIGKVNVHGYSRGTESYRGSNMPGLRRAVGSRRLWQSEYGEGDGSGYTMAQSIVLQIRGLHPSAWVYWQPVEPDVKENGWGLVNADYVDTGDRGRADINTRLVRVNRKFFVYGQFTRYLRAGFRIIDITDANSVAGYDAGSHRLVIVTVTGESPQTVKYDLSKFASVGDVVQQIVTTTAPDKAVPDWKQHVERLSLSGTTKEFTANLLSRSVYTFVIEGVTLNTHGILEQPKGLAEVRY